MKLFLIGGRPCSGKTTLSFQLGRKHNIHVEHLDLFAQGCINQSTENYPNMYRWKVADLVELLQKESGKLFSDYLKIYEEMLPFLLKAIDVSEKKELILEGSILLPKFVEMFKKNHDVKICYLLTDDAFARERYFSRDYVQNMLNKPNGKKALNNLLLRDSLFSGYINDEIKKFALPKIVIHAYDDVEKNLKRLEVALEMEE
jgi:2-phosphoglycerate kinase